MLHHNSRLLYFISRLCVCLLAVALPAAARGDVISITSIEQLQKIGRDPAYPLSGSYELARDIEAAGTKTWNNGAGFSPIGTATAGFTGKFNGRGHTVRGLHINRPATSHIGLFSSIGPGAAVSSTGIADVSITGGSFVGGLAGAHTRGAMTACYSSGTVQGISRVGGLAGNTAGTVTNCFSTARVRATGNDAGGLVGCTAGGTITNCFSTGAVSGKGASAGGLAGAQTKGAAINCFWNTQTSKCATSAGGTGKTTAEMMSRQTFSKAGWDFVHVWKMFNGRTYPSFRSANDVPAALADLYGADMHTPLVIAAPGVLANDTNPGGDNLTASIVQAPSHGNLSLQADGSFTYTADGTFTGADNFTYAAHESSSKSAPAAVTILVENKGPAAAPDSYSVSKNNPLSIAAPGVLGNDTDPGGDNLTAVIKAAPEHGTLDLHADGSFIYTPAVIGFTGTDRFTYTAKNRLYASTTATATLNLENQAPVAHADSLCTEKNIFIMMPAPGVLGNDTDANWDNLTAIIASSPRHGALVLNTDGSCIYTPAAGFTGADSFTYMANDGMQNSAPATVTLAVNSHRLSAAADSYGAHQSQPLSVASPGVLINDNDALGHTLTAHLASPPSHGALALNPDGSFLYTPASGFTGADSFTYTARGGAECSASAKVSLTVTSHGFSARADSYNTKKNILLSVASPGVLGNDADFQGHRLHARVDVAPEHGILSLHEDGSFIYIPTPGFAGVDRFTYTASNGAEHTAPEAVTITVSNPALAAAADTYWTEKNSRLSVPAPGVLDNDSAPGGSVLTALLVRGPAHGMLALQAEGSFSYTPFADFTGTDSFTYKAHDSADTSTAATVMIAVWAGSQVTAGPDSYSTQQNTALSVPAPGILANDTTPKGGSLSAALISSPPQGKLSLKADGSFIYTPTAGFTGTDGFIYQTSDGTTSSAPARVTLAVNSHRITAETDNYTIEKNIPFQLPAPGVLINDTDALGHTLKAIVTTHPVHGTLALSDDGACIYIPDTNFTGADRFSYKVSDGAEESSAAPVALTVSNSAPETSEDSYGTEKNSQLSVPAPGVFANDSDPNGDPLKTILVAGPSHGSLSLQANGSFTYIPSADFSGTDSFTYAAADGADISPAATVTLTINSQRIAAAEDSYGMGTNTQLSVPAPGVLANDSEAEGLALKANLISRPSHGSLALNADGSFIYAPVSDFSGTDSFSYTATDGFEDSPPATATITVNSHRLSAGADSFKTEKNKPLSVVAPGVLVNDSNAQGRPLAAFLIKSPAHGELAMGANGSFIYAPSKGYAGTDNFTYKASDGTEDSPPAAVTITVANRGPAAAADSYAADRNGLLSVAAHGVLVNDTDPDNDSLTAILAASPAHGALAFNADGSFTYTPSRDFKGTDTFTYRAADGTDTSTETLVTITVKAVPAAAADSYSPQTNTPFLAAAPGVLENDSAANKGKLTALLLRTTAHGSLALHADGSFTYIPHTGYIGTDSFTYKAHDGAEDSAPATVALKVTTHAAPLENIYGVRTAEPEIIRAYREKTIARTPRERAVLWAYDRMAPMGAMLQGQGEMLMQAAERAVQKLLQMLQKKPEEVKKPAEQ